MNALANSEVGDYLNEHFIATFQKVGSFRIVNGQKQGGNVASYFCTAGDGILDAVGGPVDAATLLREARWVVETRKAAMLDAKSDFNRYKMYWRLAHAERLQSEDNFGGVNWQRLPLYKATEAALTSFLAQTPAAQRLDKQGKIHLLLAVYPLVPLDQAYKVVYEKVVGEAISSEPVADRSGVSLPTVAPSWSAPSIRVGLGSQAPQAHIGLSGSLFPNDSDTVVEDPHTRAVRRARDHPPRGEVEGGTSLNVLVQDIKALRDHGTDVPTVAVPEKVLRCLNVAPGDGGPADFALLQGGGKLSWPMAWSSDALAATKTERTALETTLHEAIDQARHGQLKPELMMRLRKECIRLDTDLQASVEKIDTGDYVAAKHFMGALTAAVQGLGRPDAARYLGGSLDPAKVRTVTDLVAYLTDNDLKFGPAQAGDEWAYGVLQQALATVDRAGAPSAAPVGGTQFAGKF